MSSDQVGRRVLLAGVAAVTLVGCGARTRRPQTGADPDTDLVDDVRADLVALAGRYDAVMRRHRDVRAELRPLRAQLDEQIATLGDESPARTVPRVTAPPDLLRALTQLRKELDEGVRTRKQQCLRTESGEFARLLGAMCASHAQHALVVGRARDRLKERR